MKKKGQMSFHAILSACTLFVTLAMTTPAHAAWSWASGLPWSYSAADCTGTGTAAAAKQFKLGNTGVAVNCPGVPGFGSASASALNGWGGGAGIGAAGGGGSFGLSPVQGYASAGINVTSFDVTSTTLTLTGNASEVGSAFEELGAFLFAGDPNAIWGPPGAETIPAVSIESLISMGIIAPSDVLFELTDMAIPSSFTGMVESISPLSTNQQMNVVLYAFGEGITVPEPASIMLILIGLASLGVFCFAGRRNT